MSYRKCKSIKYVHPSFGEQNTHNRKLTLVSDLCGSEPDYLTPKRDHSYVSYLV